MTGKPIFCRLFRATEGGIAVEFALTFPLVLILVLGVIEVGYVTFANSTLNGVMREASRRGVTGFIPENQSREDYIRNKILEDMGNFSVAGDIVIRTRVYDSFANVGEPEPFTDTDGDGGYTAGECFIDVNQNGTWDSDMAQAGLGGPNAVVVYDAAVPLNLLTPVFNWVLADDDGVMQLSARAAVRNEPFGLIAASGGAAPEICA